MVLANPPSHGLIITTKDQPRATEDDKPSKAVFWFKWTVVVLSGVLTAGAVTPVLLPLIGPASIAVGIVSGFVFSKYAAQCLFPPNTTRTINSIFPQATHVQPVTAITSEQTKATSPAQGTPPRLPPYDPKAVALKPHTSQMVPTYPTSDSAPEHAPIAPSATCEIVVVSPKHIPKACKVTRDDYTYRFHDVTISCDKTQLLGEGSFAKVYRGKGSDHKEYAVRVVQSESEKSASWLSLKKAHDNLLTNFERTANSSYIISCLASYLDQSVSVTIYPCGENLSDVLKSKIFSVAEKSTITTHILSALTFLHTQGLVHRDVKETNMILFKESEKDSTSIRLVLSDLDSLSNISQGPICDTETTVDGKIMQQVVTTAGYVAPEATQLWNLANERDVSKTMLDRTKLDVWSAGIVLQIVWTQKAKPSKPSKPYLPRDLWFSFRNDWFVKKTETLPEITPESVRKPITLARRADAKYPYDLMSHILEMNPAQRWAAKNALRFYQQSQS